MESLLAQGSPPPSLFQSPGFNLQFIAIDSMHAGDLGVFQDAVGSLFLLSSAHPPSMQRIESPSSPLTTEQIAGESQVPSSPLTTEQIAGESQALRSSPSTTSSPLRTEQIAGESQALQTDTERASLLMSQLLHILGIAIRLVSFEHTVMMILPRATRATTQLVEVYDESFLMSQLPDLISSSSDEWRT